MKEHSSNQKKTVSRANANHPFFQRKSEKEPFFKPEGSENTFSSKEASFFPPPLNFGTASVQMKRNEDLPEDLQARMESSFGEDFSDVKFHRDSKDAKDLNARAYTQGNNIHFKSGEFDVSSQKGHELIAHELSHVVQQRKGLVTETHLENGFNVNTQADLEKEANTNARKGSSGEKINNFNTTSKEYFSFQHNISDNKNNTMQSNGIALSAPSNFHSNQMPIQMDLTEERQWYEENSGGRFTRLGARLVLWNFPIEAATLDANQQTALENFLNPTGLTWLHEGTWIEVIGRASNSGEINDNLELSQRRAEATSAVIRRIMSPRTPRIDIFGYGINSPLRSNNTPEGMAMNRSAEIEIRVPRPRPIPDRDSKWDYAKNYLEQRLGTTFPGNADQIWTPTSTCIVRIIPKMPLSPEPQHYGDSVPQSIGNQRPSFQYMPQPHSITIRTLGGMLMREFRLNRTLTNQQIERVVVHFIDDARQANRTRLGRLRILQIQSSQGGGSIIANDLRHYRAAERQYFVNDPFCIFRQIINE